MNTTHWFLLLLGALPTLVLGILLVRLTAKTRWKIALGVILFFLGAIWLVFGVINLDRHTLVVEQKKLETCMSFLKQVGLCIHMYAADNDGEMPPNLQALSPYADPWCLHRITHCPLGDGGAGSMFPFPRYEYCYRPVPNWDSPSDIPIVWDSHVHRLNHFLFRFLDRQYRNVLFVDGHVKTLDEEEFQASIGKPAVEPLIALLNDEDSDVREFTARTLVKITGKDFGEDPEKWQQWWAKNKETFGKSVPKVKERFKQ